MAPNDEHATYGSASSDSPPALESSQDDRNSPSSATSRSSEDGLISEKVEVSCNAVLSAEAQHFLSDVNNYLPLGCLCFEDFSAAAVEQEAEGHDVWLEVSHLPILLGSDARSGLSALAAARWIHIRCAKSTIDSRFVIFRIYLLPGDVGRRFIDRSNKRLAIALEALVREVDVSADAWAGRYSSTLTSSRLDLWATSDPGSLFYMFNSLPSPSPSIKSIKEGYAREALEDVLDSASVVPGLRTTLYPYQRRSAGLMLQRESVSQLELDPRLERRIAPDGSTFYFGPRELLFLRHPRFYEACRGGILAETMGLGKTVICIAVILATKNHLPQVPAPYQITPVRHRVGSLLDMAIAATNKNSIPWKVEFERIRHSTGENLSRCARRLEETPPSYDIPQEPSRWRRKKTQPPPRRLTLASTTLIVVPRNLCSQWHSELRKHVSDGTLRVLTMDSAKQPLPPPDELRRYDVVLFSRTRFELEIKDGADDQGRRLEQAIAYCRCPYIGATRIRDCHCIKIEQIYESPLKRLHFLRLIIDEGHFFSQTNTNAVAVAKKLVKADHYWVVSGTPARDLLGAEVDLSMNSAEGCDAVDMRKAVMEQRKDFSSNEDTKGAIRNLGTLAANFLQIKPWSVSDHTDRGANWEDCIYRHEDLRKRTYSGFSICLRHTLEAMMIKTRPEDVERDIELPLLSHEIMRLEPSFYDKLTANLFTLVLTANAVTSERTDADYLFHKNSQKARYQLIANLRQSAFFWTGFSEADILASLKNGTGYLDKEGTSCTDEDRKLLKDTMACAQIMLSSAGWRALSKSHELGLFVESWPAESIDFWAFDECRNPMLTGITQILGAQKHVNQQASYADASEGLSGAGIRALTSLRDKPKESSNATDEPILMKSGIPTSSVNPEPILRRRSSFTTKQYKVTKPKGRPRTKLQLRVSQSKKETDSNSPVAKIESVDDDDLPSPSKKRKLEPEIPADFRKTRIVGTTSAKLSYLVSQISKYYESEKILVFYDGDNVAYYIAQMLEVLHIKHNIYAKSLSGKLKAQYVVHFDQDPQDRVLIMDVKQAAFGLNLSSASRIYFVNPVCRPNVEAQAIKRAHRIGQTKKVVVETLVLRGTIEEKMLERARRMTRSEHLDAKVLEDDGGIKEIIQNARVLPVSDEELKGYGQVARLEQPQQLWGRPGWQEATFGETAVAEQASAEKKRRSILDDVTDPDEPYKISSACDKPGTSSRYEPGPDLRFAEASPRAGFTLARQQDNPMLSAMHATPSPPPRTTDAGGLSVSARKYPGPLSSDSLPTTDDERSR